jgi:quercetin dioxygenase-like cupin family protein
VTAVVHPEDVEPITYPGAEIRTTFEGALQQIIIRFPPGRVEPPPLDRGEAVLYVASGKATMRLNGARHELVPDTGVALRATDAPAFDVDEELVLVCAIAPDSNAAPETQRIVRFEDQPEEEASEERSFRYLVNDGEITQFVGIVQPSKAPFHSHPYDEVGYIIEGNGIAHVDGEEIPLKQGSCFHLVPGQTHCIENTGPGAMRILGVFHPAGSPANRSYDDNN